MFCILSVKWLEFYIAPVVVKKQCCINDFRKYKYFSLHLCLVEK